MSPFVSLLTLAAVVFLVGSWCVWAIHRATPMEPETSRLDRLDGVGICRMRDEDGRICGLRATITRRSRVDLGTESVQVCPGHSDEGDHPSRGWWVA